MGFSQAFEEGTKSNICSQFLSEYVQVYLKQSFFRVRCTSYVPNTTYYECISSFPTILNSIYYSHPCGFGSKVVQLRNIQNGLVWLLTIHKTIDEQSKRKLNQVTKIKIAQKIKNKLNSFSLYLNTPKFILDN